MRSRIALDKAYTSDKTFGFDKSSVAEHIAVAGSDLSPGHKRRRTTNSPFRRMTFTECTERIRRLIGIWE
jgi:hypothetical protein